MKDRKPQWRNAIVPIAMALSLASAVRAQDDKQDSREYQVELIVFEHLNPEYTDEDWRDAVADDEVETDAAKSRVRKAALSYRAAAPDSLKLSEILARMRSSKDYRPLMHTAWVQPGYRRDEAPALALSRVGRLPARLGGEATLYRSRYIHLTLDLQLAARPGSVSSDAGLLEETPIYSLSEERLIKNSRDLHYFDHPQFGALVKVTPLKKTDDEPAEEGEIESSEEGE